MRETLERFENEFQHIHHGYVELHIGEQLEGIKCLSENLVNRDVPIRRTQYGNLDQIIQWLEQKGDLKNQVICFAFRDWQLKYVDIRKRDNV